MTNHQEQFNLVTISRIAYRYKKHVTIITSLGLLLGILAAFLITPKFQASTIFYTPANTSLSKSLLAENNLENFMSYGDEEQIDQVLEMLNSDQLKDDVIRKFRLMQHYGIDSTDKYPQTKARLEFEDNTDFKRTDYLAIKIDVKDIDAKLATEIANYISLCLDSIRTSIQQGRAQQAFGIIGSQYQKKKREVDSILNALSVIRRQGIFDYISQSEVLSDIYINSKKELSAEMARMRVYEKNADKLPDSTIIKAKGRLAAAKAAYETIKPSVDNFGRLSGKYLELETMYEKEKEALANLQLRYESAEVDFKSATSQKFIIQKASIPEKAIYPNKKLVVLIFTVAAFLLSVLITTYLEFSSKKYQQ